MSFCARTARAAAGLATVLLLWAAAPVPAARADGAPNLSMVSVGISKYKHLNKLQSAHKDARDMADVFRAQEGKLFSHVTVKTLFDQDATAAHIREALTWVRRRAQPNGYTVVFLAGHGDSQTAGELSFQAVDYHGNAKGKASITWQQLRAALEGLPGKALLILDCCSAGAVTRADNLVVLCACEAHKISDERAHNGYFTSALIEGLSGKADADGDGVVTLSEALAYVAAQVPATTKGQQHPTIVRPPNAVSALLPLARLKASFPTPSPGVSP